jgi:hypothetical protein
MMFPSPSNCCTISVSSYSDPIPSSEGDTMTTTATALDAIDVEGAVFNCETGDYTGKTVKSIDGRVFRFLCDTCCSVYQHPLEQKVARNDGTTRPVCKFCK